ncbi:hypothetical protein C0J52_11850 [Blattella germanica]|nr:hypothetical protein C0J52_11850 [Blattella germanica]
MGCLWRCAHGVCVFDSDFGFKLNCAFKKSGLFRVRNLGGVKGYVGLGFSVGDSLGFSPPLEDEQKRRSVDGGRSANLGVQTFAAQHLAARKRMEQARLQAAATARTPVAVVTIPPFKPIPPANDPLRQPAAPVALQNVTRPYRLAQGGVKSILHKCVIRVRKDTASPTDGGLSSNTLTLRTGTTKDQKNAASTSAAVDASLASMEYYPVGYDKNFDDNFASRVELPDTSFNCGDQKHFPGLYADEDLGCMVFHVCAFTDDGLIMKSFLCPESTLFDQTILKCNWWFYVDCKSSKKLYDSNIPISKSYQLMKALAFFSSYNKS